MMIMPPLRAERSHTQHLDAPAERVFPLLCPVRETEWIEDWHPSLVLTRSGLVEQDCTWTTGDGDERAVWTTTRHDAHAGVLEFVRFGPGHTVARISIRVRAAGADRCTAQIRYRLTALPGGEDRVAAFGEAEFRAFMQRWEDRIGHYLETGTMLTAALR